MQKEITSKVRPWLPLLLIIAGTVLIGKIFEYLVFVPLIESAFKGDSFEYINNILAQHRLKNPEVRDLPFYIEEVPKYVNRLILLGIYTLTFLWAILKNNFDLFKRFIFKERSALSLAILRISVLSLILYINFPSIANKVVLLGTEAIIAPFGWPKNIISLLINAEFTYLSGLLFHFFCIGALLGIFTQKMIVGAALTGFFAIGIPQFFGKIDHHHILWHVLLILCFCRSGDSLSIDAWRKQLPQINLKESVQYGLPINLVMILIGLVYFFPGFWKFAFSGMEWIFSDNLQLKLHSKWLDLNGWTPLFRIDRYPFLYQTGALATVIIELGFIVALFFKRARWIFAIAAFGFHVSVYYFMKIPFFSTMVLYVVFINWKAVVTTLSGQHFQEKFNTPTHSSFFRKYALIGIFLVSGYLLTGALLINSWPFAVYPTFASIETDTIPTVYIEALNENDETIASTIPLLDSSFQNAFESTPRLRGFLREIVLAEENNEEQLNTVKNIFTQTYSKNFNYRKINIYYIRLNTNPDNPVPIFSKEQLISRF